jgi:hypothetical protein
VDRHTDIKKEDVNIGPVFSEERRCFGATRSEPDGEPTDTCHRTHDHAQGRVVLDD